MKYLKKFFLIYPCFLTILLLQFFVKSACSDVSFLSTKKAVTVLELYTSEGCSSCPPAEKKLNQYQDHPNLWNRFIPLAFHVNYWDYLGWTDKFAKPKFTNRQRQYVIEWQAESMYTPGFVLNGKEWKDWRFQRDLPASQESPGHLELIIRDDTIAHLRFSSVDPNSQVSFSHLAILGFAIDSRIKSGENRGKNLQHNFVVLELLRSPLQKTAENNFEASFQIKEAILTHQGYRLGIAGWIQEEGSQKPTQAVGGYL